MFWRAGSRCPGVLCHEPAWRGGVEEERGWAEAWEQPGQGQRSSPGFAEKSLDLWRKVNSVKWITDIIIWKMRLWKAVLPLRTERDKSDLRSREHGSKGGQGGEEPWAAEEEAPWRLDAYERNSHSFPYPHLNRVA